MSELRSILAAREPLYRQADLVIDTSGREVGLACADLVRALTPASRVREAERR